MTPWISGVFGILGVLVGVLFQYRFGILRSEKRKVIEMRTTAHENFLWSFLMFSNLAQDDEEQKKAHVKMMEAKAGICIYSEPEVIEAIAEAFRKTNQNFDFKKEEHRKLIVKIIKSMRKEGVSGGMVKEDDVARLIVGKEISKEEQ